MLIDIMLCCSVLHIASLVVNGDKGGAHKCYHSVLTTQSSVMIFNPYHTKTTFDAPEEKSLLKRL